MKQLYNSYWILLCCLLTEVIIIYLLEGVCVAASGRVSFATHGTGTGTGTTHSAALVVLSKPLGKVTMRLAIGQIMYQYQACRYSIGVRVVYTLGGID